MAYNTEKVNDTEGFRASQASQIKPFNNRLSNGPGEQASPLGKQATRPKSNLKKQSSSNEMEVKRTSTGAAAALMSASVMHQASLNKSQARFMAGYNGAATSVDKALPP